MATASGVASGEAARLEETLETFHKRANEAEERLAKLEALLFKQDYVSNGSEGSSPDIKNIQSKLATVNAECAAEKEKNKKLTMENEKLQYRISHLLRALKEADLR